MDWYKKAGLVRALVQSASHTEAVGGSFGNDACMDGADCQGGAGDSLRGGARALGVWRCGNSGLDVASGLGRRVVAPSLDSVDARRDDVPQRMELAGPGKRISGGRGSSAIGTAGRLLGGHEP